MPRAQVVKTNFTSGEISPQMRGRVDVNRYANGAKRLENFIVRPQGGIMRRSGTIFVAEVKDSADTTILQEFIFSSSQAYILEFGDFYIRFHQDGGRLENPATNPLELVSPWATADLRQLDFAQSADVMYITHPDYPPYKLSRLGASTNNDTVDNCANNGSGLIRVTCNAHPFTNGQNVVISGVTGTTEANGAWTITYVDANNFDLVGSAFVNPYSSGGVVGEVDWSLTKVSFTNGPYLSENGTDVELQVTMLDYNTSPTPPYTNWSDQAYLEQTLGAGSTPWVVGDVGKVVEYRDGVTGQYKLCRIGQFISGSIVIVDVWGETQTYQPPEGTRIFLNGSNVESSSEGAFSEELANKRFRYWDNAAARWEWGRFNVNGWQALGTGALNKYNEYAFTTYNTTTWRPTGVYAFRLYNRTITATVNAIGGNVFVSTDVGRSLRLVFGTQVINAVITAYTSATQVSVTLDDDPPYDYQIGTDALWNWGKTKKWSLGAWSDTTGYPSVVTFHEQRLCFANTANQPQSIWMSVTGDYENFAATQSDLVVLDDNAIAYTIVASEVNPIVWMKSGPTLLLGTTAGEWQVKASSINEPLTPSNAIVLPQTAHGSPSGVKPLRAGSATMFVTRSGRKLRELLYSFELDTFVAKDLTVLSEHMLRRGDACIDLALQKEPHSIVWGALDDGQLVGMTYEKDQEVVAWHIHPLGGTAVKVESVAAVTSDDERSDTVYMVVSRTINGGTKRYIEYMDVDFDPETTTNFSGSYFMDCGLKYSGASISTVTGLDHLEGETVQCFTELGYIGTKVVSGGQITDGTAYAQWHIGLGFTSLTEIWPPEAGSYDGSAQGKLQIVSEITAFMLKSIELEHSGNGTNWNLVLPQFPTSFEVFTGDVDFKLDDSYEKGGTFFIRMTKPYPLMLTGLSYKVNTSD